MPVAAGSSPEIIAPVRPEMIVALPVAMLLVSSIIGVPVVPDSFEGEPVEHVGNVIIVCARPGTIIVGRAVPDIAPVDPVAIVIKVQIIGDTYRHVKAQFGGLNEFRCIFQHRRFVGSVRVGIGRRRNRCRGNHPRQADVETDSARADA